MSVWAVVAALTVIISSLGGVKGRIPSNVGTVVGVERSPSALGKLVIVFDAPEEVNFLPIGYVCLGILSMGQIFDPQIVTKRVCGTHRPDRSHFADVIQIKLIATIDQNSARADPDILGWRLTRVPVAIVHPSGGHFSLDLFSRHTDTAAQSLLLDFRNIDKYISPKLGVGPVSRQLGGLNAIPSSNFGSPSRILGGVGASLHFVGGALSLVSRFSGSIEREGDQDNASGGHDRLNRGGDKQPLCRGGGALLGLEYALSGFLGLGGFVVGVLNFKRSGDAVGVALDHGGWAWDRVGAWAFIGYGACGLSALIATYWAGGGHLP